jgi:hypothetical protein
MTAFDNPNTPQKTPWAENQAVRADVAGLESVQRAFEDADNDS